MDAQLVADIPTLATVSVPGPNKGFFKKKEPFEGCLCLNNLTPKVDFVGVQDRFTAWYSWLGRSGALVPHKGALRSGCAVSRD
jgi:hypothetical protein